jgi:glucose-1-phosphate cytidylyltransferase
MKTIILCGGMGTRMKEETEFKPKPMVGIGNKPILWHIMKIYAHHGYKEFVLALGYKGEMILEHFTKEPEEFQITFAQTGLESLSGGRIVQSGAYIAEDEFMVTYGDGLADINISELVRFHRAQGTIGTITGVHPYSKYGLVRIDEQKSIVLDFEQKPRLYDYVSGGFMVFQKKALEYFDEGNMEEALVRLAKESQLSVYRHEGFWKPMDTYREMQELNQLWNTTRPWAIWEN